MCINSPLFKKIYDEGKTIIKSSKSKEIKNKEARLDKAYDNMLKKEDFECQEFYGIVHELRTYNFLVDNGYHITAQNDKHIVPDFFAMN